MSKKTSSIWDMDREEFQDLVNSHISYTDILKEFGFGSTGGPYRTLKQRIKEDNIECDHIGKTTKGRTFPSQAIPLKDVMVKNSTYSRGCLKKRLLKEGILKNKCNLCSNLGHWNGQELIMILDHINGVNDDHRLENLRMLCPNCNSQQKTFCGRNNRKPKKKCIECNVCISRNAKSQLCKKCFNKTRDYSKIRKVKNRPSKNILLKEIKELGYAATGRKYGVSDNAVRKWIN